MGREKKKVEYYNGRWKGKYLSDEDCNKLDMVRALDYQFQKTGKYGKIPELEHIIYDLTPSDIDEVIRTGSSDFLELKEKVGTLEPLQTTGVGFMFFAGRAVLGDSVGIGKTVEVAGLINLLRNLYRQQGREFRFLFLTAKTLIPQARRELIRFTGEYVGEVYGEKLLVKKFIDENYSSINYDVVGAHSLLKSVDFQSYMRGFMMDAGECPFDLLIVDESGDILSNTTTQYYKDGNYIADMFDRIVLLNATPFEKDLRAFYAQLNFVDKSFLPTKTEFSETYEVYDYYGPYPTFSGKYKNQDQFRKLVGYRYFARTRKDFGATMVDCSAEAVVVPLSKEQRELLKKTSIPQMVYDCPSYFKMGVETNIDTTPKLRVLLKLITEDLVDEPQVLVYTRYKETQRSIKELLDFYGIDTMVLNGDSSQKERENVINSFKLGDFRVLVTNVQKGLNFGNCNVCIFYTFDPSPSKMVQFEGRMTRSFDIIGKHVYLLLSKGAELKSFNTVVSDRANASDVFAGSDFSCVLELLLNRYKNGKVE